MPSRAALAKRLASLNLSHVERAIAFLWYYRHTQEFEERTASELANDLHDEDFPKPNVTRLEKDLRKSPFTIRGKRARTFQVDVRRIEELDSKYGPMLKIRPINPSDSLIPADWVGGTRQYLERLVQQINACYDNGLYDACAVLCRRLMESLIIEIYVSQKRHADIQQAGFVLQLDALISYLLNDTSVPKSAILRKAAPEVKALGDAAAHDRTYITRQTDIDAIRLSYSRMISELLRLSGIRR